MTKDYLTSPFNDELLNEIGKLTHPIDYGILPNTNQTFSNTLKLVSNLTSKPNVQSILQKLNFNNFDVNSIYKTANFSYSVLDFSFKKTDYHFPEIAEHLNHQIEEPTDDFAPLNEKREKPTGNKTKYQHPNDETQEILRDINAKLKEITKSSGNNMTSHNFAPYANYNIFMASIENVLSTYIAQKILDKFWGIDPLFAILLISFAVLVIHIKLRKSKPTLFFN